MKKLMPLVLLMAIATLSGCQPGGYRIRAVVQDGRIAFVVDGDGKIFDQSVMVYDRDGRGWVIDPSSAPECQSDTPRTPFPLTYGRIPFCYVERAPAAPLRKGVSYKVETSQISYGGLGAFRIGEDGRVVRLEPTGMGVEGEQWPPETAPDYVDPATLNGMSDNAVPETPSH
jgi:hypothetical protein